MSHAELTIELATLLKMLTYREEFICQKREWPFYVFC